MKALDQRPKVGTPFLAETLDRAKISHFQVAALPWRIGTSGVEILLVTSRGRKHWLLPKGWLEERESPSQGAAREAAEESGVVGTVSAREFGRYVYIKNVSRRPRYCEVSVFSLRVERISGKWKESRQRTRKWMSREEALISVKESDLRTLIAAFFDSDNLVAA